MKSQPRYIWNESEKLDPEICKDKSNEYTQETIEIYRSRETFSDHSENKTSNNKGDNPPHMEAKLCFPSIRFIDDRFCVSYNDSSCYSKTC